MCGICGYITSKRIDQSVAKKMINSIKYRGPNDEGTESFYMSDTNIVFSHCRLAVLDLSVRGHQPMLSKDQNYVITYNGEVYNFRELRKELGTTGFDFTTNCDTEIILKAYQKWGTACVERFNGMFSFAIFDRKENLFFAARDRLGKKPFYYYKKDDEFVFASELKPIMHYPNFNRDINESILGKYLYQGYIPSPDTIFKNTYKLEPGHYLILKNNQIVIKEYWNSYKKYEELSSKPIRSFQTAKDRLKQEIENSVKRRLISDVPFGSFLSSGIDSTLITAIAQKNCKKSIETFTVGFDDVQYNEAVVAKEIAKYLRTDHHEMYINEKDLLNLVKDIPLFYDEPFADSSQIPTMLVSKLAKKNITVALTGDGGDELFCGYGKYTNIKDAQNYDKIAFLINKVFPELVSKEKIPHNLKRILENNKSKEKTQMPLNEIFEIIDKILCHEYSDPCFKFEEGISIRNWQTKQMLLDMCTSLPDRMLQKVDRASMRYSLETRCPLLDYKVAELSFQIPHKYKFYKRKTKYILKQILYDYVPQKIVDLPKKGFGVPLDKWINYSLKEMIYDYSSENYLERQKLFNFNSMSDFLKEYYNEKNSREHKIKSEIIWRYLVFQLWYDLYLN